MSKREQIYEGSRVRRLLALRYIETGGRTGERASGARLFFEQGTTFSGWCQT